MTDQTTDTWRRIGTGPLGVQRADFDSTWWAQVGPSDGEWSWTLLENTSPTFAQVQLSGFSDSAATAKRAAHQAWVTR